LVSDNQVVAPFPFDDLAHGLPTNCDFHDLLNVADVDAKPVGLDPVDREINVGLTYYSKQAWIAYTSNLVHQFDDLLALLLQEFQVRPKEFYGVLALDSTRRFFPVVLDRLRKIPDDTRNLFTQIRTHRADQIHFGPERMPPLITWF